MYVEVHMCEHYMDYLIAVWVPHSVSSMYVVRFTLYETASNNVDLIVPFNLVRHPVRHENHMYLLPIILINIKDVIIIVVDQENDFSDQ